MCSIFAAYDLSSVSLGMTVYHILQLWREPVLPICSPSFEYIDYAGVAMCAEWKMVGFRRTSCMGNYPVLPDLLVAPNSDKRTY